MAMGPAKDTAATFQHEIVCLDGLVPAEDLYRRLDALVDLSFIRTGAAPYCAPGRHNRADVAGGPKSLTRPDPTSYVRNLHRHPTPPCHRLKEPPTLHYHSPHDSYDIDPDQPIPLKPPRPLEQVQCFLDPSSAEKRAPGEQMGRTWAKDRRLAPLNARAEPPLIKLREAPPPVIEWRDE